LAIPAESNPHFRRVGSLTPFLKSAPSPIAAINAVAVLGPIRLIYQPLARAVQSLDILLLECLLGYEAHVPLLQCGADCLGMSFFWRRTKGFT
jgi:hypothetical protein